MGDYESEQPYDPAALDELLEQRVRALGAEPIRWRVERIAELLGQATGERTLTFHLSDGNLRRTELGHRPIGNQELEQLARAG
jgi:hypothetical protein